MIAELCDRKIIRRTHIPFDPLQVDHLIQTLRGLGADILVCGAISEPPARRIRSAQIRLIPFITGQALEFLEHFAKSPTIPEHHLMPGYEPESGNAC